MGDKNWTVYLPAELMRIKIMPCRSLAHLSMAHSPLEWKRLKADVWRCDMFETWWWCLLHSKAYDFLSLHIFLCKFSIDMMGRYMWWIYENMVCLILITAIFLYRKQTLIIINRLGYRQSLCELFMTSMIKLFFCPNNVYNRSWRRTWAKF